MSSGERSLSHARVDSLRRNSAAWKLLRADNAPLIIGFLSMIFVDENGRKVDAQTLIDRLDDELYALTEQSGAQYSRSAKEYLDDWAHPDNGWLNKRYRDDSDDVYYEATPATEKAISFLDSLQPRAFVGTETRLHIAVDLLRQIVHGSETDPEVRLVQLRRQRTELDAEIERVERGEVDLLDTAGKRDRFQQFATTAKELLADFREVEANFRVLDRQMREQIATWDGSRGELIHDVLAIRRGIADSDQGLSFQAFYDFLLSEERQREVGELLAGVHAMEEVGADTRTRYIHHDWLDAGEDTQATVRLLSEQLSRFLDRKAWLEDRRIMEIIRGIEQNALAARSRTSMVLVTEIDSPRIRPSLLMERPLHTPGRAVGVTADAINEAEAQGFDAERLFEQRYVDTALLARAVQTLLRSRSQVGLADVVQDSPLQKGLSELVCYLALKDGGFDTVFDDDRDESASWESGNERRTATFPAVTYVKRSSTKERS